MGDVLVRRLVLGECLTVDELVLLRDVRRAYLLTRLSTCTAMSPNGRPDE